MARRKSKRSKKLTLQRKAKSYDRSTATHDPISRTTPQHRFPSPSAESPLPILCPVTSDHRETAQRARTPTHYVRRHVDAPTPRARPVLPPATAEEGWRWYRRRIRDRIFNSGVPPGRRGRFRLIGRREGESSIAAWAGESGLVGKRPGSYRLGVGCVNSLCDDKTVCYI